MIGLVVLGCAGPAPHERDPSSRLPATSSTKPKAARSTSTTGSALETGSASTPSHAQASHPQARALCHRLFLAPKHALDAACSIDDKKTAAYRELTEYFELPIEECTKMLSPGFAAGRLRAVESRVGACVTALRGADWRKSLRTRELSREQPCRNMLVGRQKDGEPCRVTAECDLGLWCYSKRRDTDGSCRKIRDDGCIEPAIWGFGEREAMCPKGHSCSHGALKPPHARSFLPPVAPAIERLRIALLAKSRAIRSPAQVGMVGLRPPASFDAFTPTWKRESQCEESGFGQVAHPACGLALGTRRRDTLQRVPSARASHGLAPPRVQSGRPTASGVTSTTPIQRLVAKAQGRWRLCYEVELRGQPTLTAVLDVRFLIGRTGRVSHVTATRDGSVVKGASSRGITSCVTRSFYGLVFPPRSQPLSVTTRILLEPPLLRKQRKSCVAETRAPAAATGASCKRDGDCAHGLYCGAQVQRLASGTDKAIGRCERLEATGARCEHTGQCLGACSKGRCTPFCGR